LKSVMLAQQAIATGDINIAVAGGMESMSNCPHLLPGAREGWRMGPGPIVDSMIHDGLWCAIEQCHMGNAGEVVADEYAVTRAAQDEHALRSHQKATAAATAGHFDEEMLPVVVKPRKGEAVTVNRDESIRSDATLASLSALKPAFKAGGTVTAGNAPGVSDGASALVVMSSDRAEALGLRPMVRIAGQATNGLPPRLVLMTPVEAVRRLLSKVGWQIADVDLFELNEAFSAQAVAVIRELGLDPERVNVYGGAVALGHAIGSSGARVLTTLVHALARRGLKRGVATLCLGGGNGVALAVERI